MAAKEVNSVCGGCPWGPGAGHIGGNFYKPWGALTDGIPGRKGRKKVTFE